MPDRGNCRAVMLSWGYIAKLGRCVQFIYGGCGGNDNKFSDYNTCMNYCAAEVKMQRLSNCVNRLQGILRRLKYYP
ncbi:hypothetical protein RN001_001030 [Aquatica leii]|uniref:BPTI/Kunitz inhibitor domain-containing protein n=1 Tax=Aquatica leii TaxID=1421715 RepID=A0AAN7SKY9_9COLE|nr:hypothetical protein RN001_001030 [Aquatica leii]